MSIITTEQNENGHNKLIVHLFRNISHKKRDELLLHRILETAQRHNKTLDALEDRERSDHPVEKLTEREKEVLGHLVHGFGTLEIAETLSISRNTVRNHIQHILQKLQVHSRLEAVAYAVNNNELLKY
jgi:RNA polymerase sigma factor (sigma-70 family)